MGCKAVAGFEVPQIFFHGRCPVVMIITCGAGQTGSGPDDNGVCEPDLFGKLFNVLSHILYYL